MNVKDIRTWHKDLIQLSVFSLKNGLTASQTAEAARQLVRERNEASRRAREDADAAHEKTMREVAEGRRQLEKTGPRPKATTPLLNVTAIYRDRQERADRALHTLKGA